MTIGEWIESVTYLNKFKLIRNQIQLGILYLLNSFAGQNNSVSSFAADLGDVLTMASNPIGVSML